MAFTPKNTCKICTEISGGDDKLFKRIWNLSYYHGPVGETAVNFLKTYPQFNTASLRTHCLRHQRVSQKELRGIVVSGVDGKKAGLADEMINHTATRALIIKKGYRLLEANKIKVGTKDLLSALKQEADISAKKTDQGLLMTEMAMKFMSGEVTDVIAGTTGESPGPRANIIDVPA
jgi:hypothetical protein